MDTVSVADDGILVCMKHDWLQEDLDVQKFLFNLHHLKGTFISPTHIINVISYVGKNQTEVLKELNFIGEQYGAGLVNDAELVNLCEVKTQQGVFDAYLATLTQKNDAFLRVFGVAHKKAREFLYSQESKEKITTVIEIYEEREREKKRLEDEEMSVMFEELKNKLPADHPIMTQLNEMRKELSIL